MAIPGPIHDLVERFKANRDAYRSAAYNESQCRLEFINPFFLALGWDMDNKAGYSETYKDVIHEDAIKMGEAVKATDAEIDRQVYALYGLTAEEIKIVEGAAK